MKKLYFKHSDGGVTYINDIQDDKNNIAYVDAALKDLKMRNPKYKSYYQRVWTDDNGCTHIDVGSWSEEYIVKDD